MSYPALILPQADAACGKTFFADRRTADCHRIALEVWNRATGRSRPGYRLSIYRCRRCGGFHLGQKAVATAIATAPTLPACRPDPERRAGWSQEGAVSPAPGRVRPFVATSPSRSRLRGRASSPAPRNPAS